MSAVAKRHGVSEQTIYAWRKRFGGFQAISASALSRPVRLLFSPLFAAALAQPTNEPSDRERGQQKRDDHAYTDEHIGENDCGGVHDGPGARRRSASMPLYGQSSGSPRRFIRSFVNAGAKIGRPKERAAQGSEV